MNAQNRIARRQSAAPGTTRHRSGKRKPSRARARAGNAGKRVEVPAQRAQYNGNVRIEIDHETHRLAKEDELRSGAGAHNQIGETQVVRQSVEDRIDLSGNRLFGIGRGRGAKAAQRPIRNHADTPDENQIRGKQGEQSLNMGIAPGRGGSFKRIEQHIGRQAHRGRDHETQCGACQFGMARTSGGDGAQCNSTERVDARQRRANAARGFGKHITKLRSECTSKNTCHEPQDLGKTDHNRDARS